MVNSIPEVNCLNIALDYLRDFGSDQRGAAAAEYVMILAIVGTGLSTATFLLSGAISGGFGDVAELIDPTGCNNQGLGEGFGGGQGGGGGEGAGSGEGNTC